MEMTKEMLLDEMFEQQTNRELEEQNNEVLFEELAEWQKINDYGDRKAEDYQ